MTQAFPFILDGFPRCGSTTLTRVLNAHPDIRCCMEPFHPKRYGGQFNEIALQQGSVKGALDLIRLRWNGLKHVWEPGTAWPFDQHQELNDDLVTHAGTIITVRRRNLLRQFVSSYISKNLGFWVGTSAEFYERLDTACLPALTVDKTRTALEEMIAAHEKRDRLLATLPARQEVLYYEDIFEGSADLDQHVASCNALFVVLGHCPLEDETFRELCGRFFDPMEYKWANNEVYARIPGAQLVDKELASENTGSLFY